MLLDAVAARRDAAADAEEWMVLVGTDHGGSARRSMDTATSERFDALRGGDAYGQRGMVGVHGLASLRAHTTTFLLVLVPPHVDPGGEILDDDVRNSDVAVTLCHWFGVEHEDLPGKARGVGLGKDPAEGFWCDQRCCAVKDIIASAERKRELTAR